MSGALRYLSFFFWKFCPIFVGTNFPCKQVNAITFLNHDSDNHYITISPLKGTLPIFSYFIFYNMIKLLKAN